MGLNYYLLETYKKLYLDEVVVHEFAHIVTMIKYENNVSAHGKEWKDVAKKLRLEKPKATTGLFKLPSKDTINPMKQFLDSYTQYTSLRYKYICQCRKYIYTSKEHKRAIMFANINNHSQICQYCKDNIKFLEEL